MGKTFEVELDGKVRRLAFHQRDAIDLKNRFKRPIHQLLFLDALGMDFSEELEPGKLPSMNRTLFDPEVQFAFLHRALLRGGWNVTEEKLINFVDAAVQASDGATEIGDFFVPALRCALYSGAITGAQVDIATDGEAKPEAPAEGAAVEGKESTSAV